ncbi:hypothetical protein Y032_0184g1015 [Ancylostoma ceylanicum]|uniref:Uncharacterized protein n=1 Tax=Ancylostoma ceylanicum TaxID=53326 RepID=A0A016SS88_9BILA|nr:hypothetical protein Y032_0184g1015 [Ancylostoma ceylanicum]
MVCGRTSYTTDKFDAFGNLTTPLPQWTLRAVTIDCSNLVERGAGIAQPRSEDSYSLDQCMFWKSTSHSLVDFSVKPRVVISRRSLVSLNQADFGDVAKFAVHLRAHNARRNWGRLKNPRSSVFKAEVWS